MVQKMSLGPVFFFLAATRRLKVAGPPRPNGMTRHAADCSRAAGQSNRRYRPWLTVCDALRAGCSSGRAGGRVGYRWGGGRVTLVMGMISIAPQISAEWIDTVTGEVSRARIAPADRAGVRKFLAQFQGRGSRVALEATTGWRFVVEELDRVGAASHPCGRPAETSGLKGKKQRAKTDWADARHLRELLLIGRLPESWIAPAHLLDLRARVRVPPPRSWSSERSGSDECTRCSITNGCRQSAQTAHAR